ncbi:MULTISPECIES: TonB-dependent siderophore receptor [unclassified Janthinobacterium]|uniref:TonB-dependent receptor n=1 Tax=unclassified Janthinobacterium TaxID=2610881 RepID=UPI00161FBB24|nr:MULTISPECIES: TonB-dependent receptor [unclassified Janthinobacterium]MBB5610980.1 catecholate siderophore receptor [Janthinobacterium sp. S3T4]MBB5616466.1 catecholate siderophore receptor [Janthinobacterium sp. S3M3]
MRHRSTDNSNHSNSSTTADSIASLFAQYGKLSATVGLAITSLGATASGTALAADADAATTAAAEPQQLNAVVVKAERVAPAYKPEHLSSAKFAQPLLDTPQSITIVPREVLTEQNAQNLQDILKNVPGITFTSGEGNLGWGDLFTIRGFSSEQSLTVDGMRDAGMSSRNDTFNLDQVEVFKGTGSIESGTSAVGGTVNLVSKEARLGNSNNVSVGVGSAAYRRVTTDLNRQLDAGSALRFNVMKQKNDVPGRDVTNNNRQGLATSFVTGLDGPTRIYVDLFHQEDKNVPDGGLPIQRGTGGQPMANVPHSAWFGSDAYTQQTTADSFTLKLEHDFAPGVKIRNQSRWALTDNLSVLSPARFNAANANGSTQGTSLGYVGVGGLTKVGGIASYTDFNNVTQPYGVLRGGDFGTSKRYKIAANQTDFSLAFDTGFVRHEVVTGLDLYRESYGDLQRTVNAPTGTLWFNMANPQVVHGSVPTVKGSAGLESQISNAGLYVTDAIRFTPQWRMVASLRYDRWKADTSTLGVSTSSSSAGAVSGRVAAMYKPVDDASIYIAYAQAAQPSAIGASTNNAIYGSAAASAYSPATSKTVELGGKWDVLQHRLALTGAIFRTSVNDSWEYGDDDVSPVRALPAKRVQGAELGVQGNITQLWSVYGGMSRLMSKQTKGINQGSEAKNVPDLTFNIWTSYEAAKGLVFSYGAQYVGERRYSDNAYVGGLNNNSSTVNGPAGKAPVYVLDTEKAPSYWVQSLAARYRVNERLALNLNVQNLANKFYWARIGSSLDGFQLYGVPGASRSVSLSADLSF